MGWYENEEFWIEFYDFLFGERRFSQAEDLLDHSPLFSFSAGSQVLDLCCGPGVFTVPLARRGHATTGVDRSPAMVQRARHTCAAAGVEARIVQADALEFVEPQSYDVVLNMFTSFGYCEDPADNARILRNMHANLVPGGLLLLDVAGKEILARNVLIPKVVRRGDDLVVQTDTVLDDWARMRSDWVLMRSNRICRASLVWFIYSAVELRAMVAEAGFTDVECFGGFDAQPYDENAERLIIRASAAPLNRLRGGPT